VIPGNPALWARAHGVAPERIHLAEDGAGVSVLKKPPPDDSAAAIVVFVNGIGQSWIPFGGIHSVLGALPAMMHPKPEDIAIIGRGSGDTLFSAASRIETKSIICVEIIGAELETLRLHAEESGYAGVRALLEDGRIQHVTGDGRRYLMTTGRRFDIIEADALRPTSAHSGNLYSEEYFRLLLSRLKPGGFAVTWAPTDRVSNTFASVFPHVLVLPHILIGSSQPVPWDADTLRLRLGHLEYRHHFAMAGIDLPRLLAPYLDPQTPRIVLGPDFDRASLPAPNTDLFPRDELAIPALWSGEEGSFRAEESLFPEKVPSIHE
jgi:hypothetical protein